MTKQHYITIAIISLLAGLCIGLSGCSSTKLGADKVVEDKIDIKKEVIKLEQEQEKGKDGKYKYKPKYKKDDVEYEVHEYVTPRGEVGYQIFINTDEYSESIGYGEESISRTWKKEKNLIATSTK